MRVLLVVHRFPPDGLTGVERITQALAMDLTRLGHRVAVVSRRAQPSDPVRRQTETLPDGIVIHRFVAPMSPRDQFLLDHQPLEALFQQVLLEVAPDVVHFLHLMDLSPRFVELAHRHGAAVVMSLQDFYVACPLINLRKRSGELCAGPDGGRECARTCFAHEAQHASMRWGLRQLYFRRILGCAERIIVPSSYVQAFFEHYGAARERIHVIPNGVSITPKTRTEVSHSHANRRLTLAYLGSVQPLKGPHLLLEGLRLAGLPAVDLRVLGVAGIPEYTETLRQMAATIPGLRMQLCGGYEPDDLPLLLSGVDCVVQPSLVPETFGIAVREALTQGIPVITTRLGGLPEAVVEGENGFTFDHTRPAELAVILRRLADDETLRRRLRRGAWRTPVTSVAEHAEQVQGVYEAACHDRRHRPATQAVDLEELRFLHSALLHMWFDPHARLA